MMMGSFGPYHGLWLDDAPTKHMGVVLTPWAVTDALVLVKILQVHKKLLLSRTAIYCDF
jgi:hypothetical protein